VAAVTLVLWSLLLVGLLPARALGRGARWTDRIRQLWAGALLCVLGARVTVEGRPPRGGFLLVANHLSYVDVLVLSSALECTFVSKAEVARWPLVGWLARSAGTLFVERGDRRGLATVAERMRARLAAGEALVLFPEGTSTAGAGVLAFRPSLLQPACELGLAVHAAALRYRTPAGSPPASHAIAWWGDDTFVPHLVDLLRLSHFEAHVSFAAEPIASSDRKDLAARLHRAVVQRFVPLEPPARPGRSADLLEPCRRLEPGSAP